MANKRSSPAASKRPAAAPARKPEQAKKVVSIPDDVVLAPQAEPPRAPQGRDASRARPSAEELTWGQFDLAVQGLAREVAARGPAVQAVVGLAHGGVFVGGALAKALGVEFYPVRISRRSRDKGVQAPPRISGEMPRELKGRRVLLVDDVAKSGDTLRLAGELARGAGAREVRTLTLVARPGGYEPDHCALVTDALVVFPWDYEQVSEESGRFDVDPDKAGA